MKYPEKTAKKPVTEVLVARRRSALKRGFVEAAPDTIAPRRGPGRRSNEELAGLLRGECISAQTGQEFRTLGGAISCGSSGEGWRDTPAGRVWSRADLPGHFLLLDAPLLADGWEASYAGFTEKMTATHYLAILWIVSRLKEAACGRWQDARGIVDLADVADAVYPDLRVRSKTIREDARRMVWQAIRFGEMARIRGDRTNTTYKRPEAGKRKPLEVQTRIDSALWMLGEKELAAQKSLFGDDLEIPLRTEIVMSQEWATLLTNPKTMQFVNLAERLGKVPPGKPAGALARSVGLALFELWRRGYGREGQAFSVPRFELWSKYLPMLGSPDDILAGVNPARAREVWAGALDYLCEVGIVDKATARDCASEPTTRQAWAEAWRKEPLRIPPALAIRGNIWPEKCG